MVSSSPKSTSKKACCGKVGLKRGPWRPDEDELLINCIRREGEGRWRTLPKRAGLLRCGKSCRLRWMNYLRPSVKRGSITSDEEDLILRLHRLLGNRWSLIAGRIPGRTDNEIKNYWNTHISKKLISQGLDPRTHKPLNNINPNPYHHHHECLVSFPYADERHSSSNRLLLVSPELNPNPNCASASMSSHEILDTKSVDNSENQQHLIKRVTSTLDNQEQDLNNISDGGLIMGFPNMEEDGDRINNNTEDIFSSFLDSLINEEI